MDSSCAETQTDVVVQTGHSAVHETRTEETPVGSIHRERNFRYHDALKRTGSLLGEDDDSKDWISETRSRFSHCASATLPRQRPALFVTSLDGSRRHNPHSRMASLFKARHGQRDVCMVETLLPEAKEAEMTQQSAYGIEFPKRPVAARIRWQSAPAVPHGILPNFRVPQYDDVRHEMLLPVEISEKSPSTNDPNKYIPRRRRVVESLNQHTTHDTVLSSQRSNSHHCCHRQPCFQGEQGRPLPHRRHVLPPATSLTVKGFDGGATKRTETTMHARLLPFLRVPRII